MSKVELPLGFYRQRDSNLISCRVEVPGGNINDKQLIAIAKILETNTKDNCREPFAHNSTRQNIIIVNLPFASVDEVTETLKEVGLKPGSAGPVVRNIVSCLGDYQCPHSLVDTQYLSSMLLKEYSGMQLRSKLKISVGGCPNACVNPYTDDIGIHGVAYSVVNAEACERYQNGQCGKELKTICTKVCQEDAISIVNGGPAIDYKKCTRDGDCVAKCPAGTFTNAHHGYTIYMGGRQGRRPRLAFEVVNWIPTGKEQDVVRITGSAIDIFNERDRGKRLGHVIDNLGGLDSFKAELFKRAEFTPYQSPVRQT